LCHVSGDDGQCETDIANYSVKYALYGRVDLDAAIYVEAENKYNVLGLVRKIYKRLVENSKILEYSEQKNNKVAKDVTKGIIFEILHEKRYVIIIDKCQNLIDKANESFNKFIKELISRTINTKLILISKNKEDIS
jgi:hypothetical protein